MKPNVDLVNLIAIQELADNPTPLSLTDYIATGPIGNLLGYKNTYNDVVQLIATALQGQSIIPQRVYRIGVDMPAGSSISGDRTTIYDPYLDGRVYDVNKRGWELLIKGYEWDNDVINPVGNVPGGFRLLATPNGQDIFSDGDIVILTFQQQFSAIIPGEDAVARFAAGERIFTANGTIGSADFRKIIRCRSLTSSLSINLPLASAYPDGVILTIVSDGGSQKQVSLNCAGSDNIFWDGQNWPTFYLGRNDEINLIKSSGGWGIAYWSGSERYNKIGSVEHVYSIGPNQYPLNSIIPNPAPVLRSVYPGFFNYLKKLAAVTPSLVVNNGTWLANQTLFGLGDGDLNTGTTFNFPNWNGLFIRNIDPSGTIDIGRGANGIPASLQADDNKSHTHSYQRIIGSGGNANFLGGGNFNAGSMIDTTSSSGTESRPKNGTLILVINY